MSYQEVYKRNLKIYIQIISQFLLKTKQGYIEKVKDAIVPLTFKIPRKIQKKDFLNEGKIPIIDQGQSFIAGYTDDDLALIKNVPIVIFGDHTRAIKYIDFPFAQGADGVKMLIPKKEYLPEFFFFQMQSVDLESRGYSRHYKYLLEHKVVGVKNANLQKNIVLFLRHLEKNELKSNTYFNLETELRIASLQNSSLKIAVVSNNNKNEESMIQELRQAILREAVSGKLVPQDPNDEPASQLLKQVKIEKEKLIKNGKIGKDKELPLITEKEVPFEIPAGWVWARLGEITTKIGSGSTPLGGKKIYEKTGIQFIRSQNVWDTGLELDDVVYIKEEIHKKMDGTRVFQGDILLNITGASIGRTCVVPSNFNEGNVSQHVSIIRIALPSITRFIHFFLQSSYLQSRIMDVQVGVSREGLSKKNMELFVIPIPPLSEQNRITQKLDYLTKVCTELENKVKENQNNSKILMEAVLNEALVS